MSGLDGNISTRAGAFARDAQTEHSTRPDAASKRSSAE
jgi:hypothetical protein